MGGTSEATESANYIIKMEASTDAAIYQISNIFEIKTLTTQFGGVAPTYFAQNEGVTLQGYPSGGTFSGTGISTNTFDPATAGLGTHTIFYNLSTSCVAAMVQTDVQVITDDTTARVAYFQGGAYDGYGASSYESNFSKLPLTVSASGTREYCAATVAYNYSFNGFDVDDNSTMLDDLPAVATNALVTSAVGNYTTTTSGGSDNKYEYIYESGSLEITKKQLDITVNAATKKLWGY